LLDVQIVSWKKAVHLLPAHEYRVGAIEGALTYKYERANTIIEGNVNTRIHLHFASAPPADSI
jgi:hypothetical protein